MSNKSSSMKKQGGNVITKKMMQDRMQQIFELSARIENVVIEWEKWHRSIKFQLELKEKADASFSQADYDIYLNSGPVFDGGSIEEKIAQSVKQQVDIMFQTLAKKVEESQKAVILDQNGNNINKTDTPIILDNNGKPAI